MHSKNAIELRKYTYGCNQTFRKGSNFGIK